MSTRVGIVLSRLTSLPTSSPPGALIKLGGQRRPRGGMSAPVLLALTWLISLPTSPPGALINLGGVLAEVFP